MKCLLYLAIVSTTLLADRVSADETPATNLQSLQGTWERTGRGNDKQIVTVRKQITGDSETITYTDKDGTVLREHRAEFKLEVSGRIQLFTYFNLRVTAGAKKGELQAAPSSYIYRLDDDEFTEVHGMLVGDKGTVRVSTYQRVVAQVAAAGI